MLRHLSPCVQALVLAGLAAAALPAALAQDPDRDAACRRRTRALEERIVEACRRAAPAVVTVRVSGPADRGPSPEGSEGEPFVGGGSGVVIRADGEILTCDHVVAGSSRIEVGLYDGRRFPATVVGRDPTGDIAILGIEVSDLPTVPFGDSDALRVGDLVIALGNPFELAEDQHPAATLGIVSGLDRFQGGERVYGAAIQTDAAINPGSSGGPLIDLDGRLLGICGRISVRAGEETNVGIGFAIPAAQILRFLPDLEAGREVAHAYLGVRLRMDAPGPGAEVAEVLPGGPAEAAGLRPGDVIVRFGGREVTDAVRLQGLVAILPADATVSLAVRRGARETSVDVVLGARPAPQDDPMEAR